MVSFKNSLQLIDAWYHAVGGVYLAERLNHLLARNWKCFAGQNYFDPRGLFLSILWSGPLLIIAMIILVSDHVNYSLMFFLFSDRFLHLPYFCYLVMCRWTHCSHCAIWSWNGRGLSSDIVQDLRIRKRSDPMLFSTWAILLRFSYVWNWALIYVFLLGTFASYAWESKLTSFRDSMIFNLGCIWKLYFDSIHANCWELLSFPFLIVVQLFSMPVIYILWSWHYEKNAVTHTIS